MSSPHSPRDWFDYLSALTPALIAVFVAFVAYRQWIVARQKLRLDLYNRRFSVFETTLRLYQESLREADATDPEYDDLHRKFITAMIEARFLFSPESGIAKLLEDFNKSIFIIKGTRGVLKEPGFPPEEATKIHINVTKEQMQLQEKLEDLERRMKPYLTFYQRAE